MYSPPSVVSIGVAKLLAALIAMLIVMSAGLTNAQAASSDGPAFSVRAVYESALALNPEAQSQKKRIEALMAKKESATAWTAQPLSLESSYRSDRNYNNQGLREVELGFSAPLWNWNERSRTQSLRDSELQTANAQFEAAKLGLAAEVRQVVWDTLSAQLDVEIAQTRAQAANKLTDDVKRRVDAGELAKTDLYQAQALHAQAKSEMGRAMAALSDMAIQFSELTGLPISTLQGVQAENTEIPQGLRPLDHPSLKVAQSQLHTLSKQTELTITQKRANPELGLTVVSDRSAFGIGSEKSLMFSTRIPLGNASEYQSRVLDAQANQLAAQASLSKIERSVVAKGRAAGSSLQVFEHLRKTASEQAELAKRVYALYQQSFELGETDLPTLLRYEQQAFEAERLARKSDIEYAAKVSAYKQALGLLPE